MNVVSIDGLSVAFEGADGRKTVVDDVSLSVPHKKTVALVGESGSGKTVISQAIMGLLPDNARITAGSIIFREPGADEGGIDIASLDPAGARMRAIRGDRIAIIFQEPMTSLSPLHTIGNQISEAVRLHRGRSGPEAREVTLEMLRLVRFPDPARALDTFPFELSGGLRQRAMIAMALVCRPALLIADEPTTALDVTIQAEILKLIREMQSELDMSVLMITHDFGVVANMADEVVVIYHGRIMESGPAEAMFRDPQHPYLKALLAAVPRFQMTADERLVPIRPISTDTDVNPPACSDRHHVATGAPLLVLKDVEKTFFLRKSGWLGGERRIVRALDRVSLTVHRGECLGLVGESGSGKTTTAKAVLRGIDIDGGTIAYDRGDGMEDVTGLAGDDLMDYRRRVQLIFQDPFSSLNPRMTVNECLSEPLLIHRVGTPAERAERVRELMRIVGLDPRFLRRYPHSFSGGQRQRIGIARALALQPELILCDEPVSALDVSVQAQILNLLRDLKADLGLTYLFVSHNLAVVDYIADRIAVMCKGRLVEVAGCRAVIDDPIHPYTKALLAAVPEPSLDHLLDFSALSASRASDPGAWPEPFRIEDGTYPALVEMRPGHLVCAPGLAGDSALKEAV
ncbi:peptide/nickel transport system ATP-binding protein [Rhodobium orientis]|uniref:ABC transporter ATP-binding protein n=1 Tax=Rhodobium orientis TaxID=34017 RepID=A0A327JJR6_9HYPH|nr:ABC transporter ATP-binding protein [Rhodobium orientis]MBB4305069.1 peptide/nickel transport system ATP-binding protein [Rhodobium orientis]MBK5949879.1 ABC transporter ATP-binding protein [Rhodobium orientis]RAI25644.1 ABC transporter ATP-binding protein [Rhodobium orientis]